MCCYGFSVINHLSIHTVIKTDEDTSIEMHDVLVTTTSTTSTTSVVVVVVVVKSTHYIVILCNAKFTMLCHNLLNSLSLVTTICVSHRLQHTCQRR
jgi:hypothetical protein